MVMFRYILSFIARRHADQLNLAGNDMDGSLPPELGNIPHLRTYASCVVGKAKVKLTSALF